MLKFKIVLKSFQWEPNCAMRTDGRTDVSKLMVDIRNLANVPKNESEYKVSVEICVRAECIL